jgi:hypothetical protein
MRTLHLFISSRSLQHLCTGVECPAVGNFNAVGPPARVHHTHTVRMSSYRVGAARLVVPTEDQVLDDYTVTYSAIPERHIWSCRGKVQEADLRRKHAESLCEMLPKFNGSRLSYANSPTSTTNSRRIANAGLGLVLQCAIPCAHTW